MPRKVMAGGGPKTPHRKGREFQPGESGNPEGRKVLPEGFRDACRLVCWDHLKTMRSILENPKVRPEIKIKAFEVLSNRGFGQPKAEVEVTDSRVTPVIFAPPRCHSFEEWLEKFGPDAKEETTH